MSIKALIVLDNESMSETVIDKLNAMNMELELSCFETVHFLEMASFDIVCIISMDQEAVIQFLKRTDCLIHSFKTIVFTLNIDGKRTAAYLNNGADIVCMYKDDAVIAQLEAYRRSFYYSMRFIDIGDITYRPIERVIEKGETKIHLNSTESSIMQLLLDNQQCIVTYDTISRFMRDGTNSSAREYAKVYVHRLRKSLKSIGSQRIKIVNHYSQGYSMIDSSGEITV